LATLGREDLSASERLEAAAKLSEIPVDSIPAALEKVTSSEDYELSFPAKLLLVRWAGIDGEAAARWAWHRVPSLTVWGYAFDQIGPAWEWHDSRAFGIWVTQTAIYDPKTSSPAKDPSSEQPAMNSTLLESASEWLVRDQPRLAIETRKKMNFGLDDSKLIAGLETTAQIQEALGACEPLDGLLPASGKDTPPVTPGGAILFPNQDGPSKRIAMEILQRWKQIDPADFGNSKFASLIPDGMPSETSRLDQFADLPLEERPAQAILISTADLPYGFTKRVGVLVMMMNTWIDKDPQQCLEWAGSIERAEGENGFPAKAGLLSVAFDAWSDKHPGENPDQSGWSPERVRAWADLQALRQAAYR